MASESLLPEWVSNIDITIIAFKYCGSKWLYGSTTNSICNSKCGILLVEGKETPSSNLSV